MPLRPATLDDVTLIQDLANESWKDTYGKILSKEQLEYMLDLMYSTQNIVKQMNQETYHYHIIQNQQLDPVGFIGFETNYEDNTTKLHRLYLIPSAKGLGLGKTTMNQLKIWTKVYNNNRIILTVNKNNTAKEMYEKQGFKVYHEGIFDIGNGYVMDDYLMEYTFGE